MLLEKKKPNPDYLPPEAPKNLDPMSLHKYYMDLSDHHDRHANKHTRLRDLQNLWSSSRAYHDDRHQFHKAMRDGYAQKALGIDLQPKESETKSGFNLGESYTAPNVNHVRNVLKSLAFQHKNYHGTSGEETWGHCNDGSIVKFDHDNSTWAHVQNQGNKIIAAGQGHKDLASHLMKHYQQKFDFTESSDPYELANKLYSKRNDWDKLEVRKCIGMSCGQKFKVEVPNQTLCRDCHSNKSTGFYRPGIAKTYESFENPSQCPHCNSTSSKVLKREKGTIAHECLVCGNSFDTPPQYNHTKTTESTPEMRAVLGVHGYKQLEDESGRDMYVHPTHGSIVSVDNDDRWMYHHPTTSKKPIFGNSPLSLYNHINKVKYSGKYEDFGGIAPTGALKTANDNHVEKTPLLSPKPVVRTGGSKPVPAVVKPAIEAVADGASLTLVLNSLFESKEVPMAGAGYGISALQTRYPKVYNHLVSRSKEALANTGDPAGEYGTLHHIKSLPPSKQYRELEHSLVHHSATSQGPDMAYEKTGRLLTAVRKSVPKGNILHAFETGKLDDHVYNHIKGPSSDRFRHSGDRYY